MRLHHYLCLVLPLVATIMVSSCKKQDIPQPTPIGSTDQPVAATEDTLARLKGEWICNGQNTAAHVQFTSASTWIALDTDLVVTNRTVRITMPHCDTVLVQTDGYDEYMAYTDVGATYIRCDKRTDANTIYFVDNKYDGYYGYGNGSHLTYYIAQDSLVFYSDFRSYYNRFMMSVSGKRK
jgi:hypothetical protein